MKIQWARIVVAAFAIEAFLIVSLVPLGPIIRGAFGERAYFIVECVLLFTVAVLVTMWFVRKVRLQVLLHGALIGVVATLLFLGLTVASGLLTVAIDSRGPVLFVFEQVLRIIATVAGAFLSERRRSVGVRSAEAI